MATVQTNQKVFVSPGVYTSETDLSFVAQSVGVTTLGLVGETQKGPAFEPIFITNYDEFQAFFGGTSPEKFVNTQIPKYEASYIAKSYLQQSNQLFVTRILGLSGYDAGPSWSIKVIADVNGDTISLINPGGNPFIIQFSGNTIGNGEYTFTNTAIMPSLILNNLTKEYRKYNGGTSTMQADFGEYLNNYMTNNSLTGSTLISYGSIPTSEYNFWYGTGGWNFTNVYGVDNLSWNDNRKNYDVNDPWYYANFEISNGDVYTGYSFYYYCASLTPTTASAYTGTLNGLLYSFTGECATYRSTNVNGMVVATLRSRGISEFNSDQHGPKYQVSGTSDLGMVCSSAYSGVSQNPFATFNITGRTIDNDTFSFDMSMDSSSSKYLPKVLGMDNFSKNRVDVPIFVEEIYGGALEYLYNYGSIRGLSCNIIPLPAASSSVNKSSSIAWKYEKYQTPVTPFLVSELRGNQVYDLFRFVSISDGDSANTEIKVSIANISFNNQTFDVLVRNFYDTDTNPVVIEKFTNCNLDENSNNFIAKKIGSFNGEYALNSRYIMVEMADEFPTDALPCGFNGYTQRQYGSNSINRTPIPIFKTRYFTPNYVLYNPPFGLSSGGDNVVTVAGDNIRRTYLGFSTQFGIDDSLIQYKGKVNPTTNWSCAIESVNWNTTTKGFHMDKFARDILFSSGTTNSGETRFYCGEYSFDSEPTDQSNGYYYIYSRKYTLCFAGGFDGWDIYRERRTNESRFRLGGSGYLAGASVTCNPRYPNCTGDGAFKPITVNKNTTDWANTDYYAYLLGIETFSNPEATNINIFATAGIDIQNHDNLVEEAINMVQYNRADSIYITTMPDYNLLLPDANDPEQKINPQEAVDLLNETGIDSNYTATYYPWILVRDTVNNTQIYIPPTGEVCRNLALTDNVSFPWFASAGYTRGLVNSVKARTKLTQEDRDTLYQGRINPIATFSDVGTVIWGNKTLQIADSALNRLNVRRLLLQARKLISAVSVRLLFEQNDQIVRQQFLDSVNPILDSIRRDRGLYDFRVTVSSSVEDLDRNTLTGKIYLKPTRALEFIDIEFLITPTGASFENI